MWQHCICPELPVWNACRSIIQSSLHSPQATGCTGLLQFICARGCCLQISSPAEHDLKMKMPLTSAFVACPCNCSYLQAESEHVDTFCIQWFPLRVGCVQPIRGLKRQHATAVLRRLCKKYDVVSRNLSRLSGLCLLAF